MFSFNNLHAESVMGVVYVILMLQSCQILCDFILHVVHSSWVLQTYSERCCAGDLMLPHPLSVH